MSNNLLTMADQAMGDAMAPKLAGLLDASSHQTAPALAALLPALMAGVAGRGDSLNGAGALLSFTDQTRIDGALFGRLPSLMDDAPDTLLARADLGKSLLMALFGEPTIALTHELAALSGLSTEAAGRLMGLTSLLLFSMLKSEVKRLDLGAAGLQQLLSSQQAGYLARVDPRLSRALALDEARKVREPELPVLSTASGRSPANTRPASQPHASSDRASTPRPAATRLLASSGFSLPHWLPWVLATLLVLWGVSWWVGRAAPERDERAAGMSTGGTASTSFPAPVRIYFETGKYDSPDESSRLLANIIDFSKVNYSSLVRLKAWQEAGGDPAAMAKLAKNRAMTVRSVLISGGITEDRISIDPPGSSDDQSDGSAARRVDVSITR